jgi:hypothetical protein
MYLHPLFRLHPQNSIPSFSLNTYTQSKRFIPTGTMRLTSFLPAAFLVLGTYADDSAAPPERTPDPPTAGEIWTAKWDTASLQPFTQHCFSRNTYEAKIYKLSEMYPDLKEQAPELKVFYNKQLYAGSWDGVVSR